MYEIEFINNLRPLYPYFQITITIMKIIIHKNIKPNNRNNYFYELIKFRLTTIMVSIRINRKIKSNILRHKQYQKMMK